MSKLIFGINLTIDGCCDHTKGIPDEEVHEYFAQLTREADILLYGRKTYELMVPFWPDMAKNNSGPTKSMTDFAQAFDSVKKIVVVSRTLGKVDDPKTSIIRSDLEHEIQKLKQEPGKTILTGGVDIPSQLIQLGLIDEFHIVVQPIVAGAGRRFMDSTNLPEGVKPTLVETKVFRSGCVAMRYVK